MATKPVRVLHVLGSLDRGGAETWTVQLLEHLDRRRVQADVLVHRGGGTYEHRVHLCGAQVFTCDKQNNLLGYITNLRQLFLERGPYHIVHSHLQLFSGVVLRTAYKSGVPGRIAHTRNSNDGKGILPQRIIYRTLMRHWIRQYATHLFAVSSRAAEDTFTKSLLRTRPYRIMTGIDLSQFHSIGERVPVRAELGLPSEALVVGHVGSFREQKNHMFLVKIAEKLLALQPNTIFLLVGKGSLKPLIKDSIRRLGMDQKFVFLEEYNNVPRLLQAIDVFVFPSLYEGLPRVLLEAQAAGVPCIASNTITIEARVDSRGVTFLSLAESPEYWAQTSLNAAQHHHQADRSTWAVQRLSEQGFDISANARELTDLYEAITSDYVK